MKSYSNLQEIKSKIQRQFGDRTKRMDRLASVDVTKEILNNIEQCILSSDVIHIRE